jgi:hypothetical protein
MCSYTFTRIKLSEAGGAEESAEVPLLPGDGPSGNSLLNKALGGARKRISRVPAAAFTSIKNRQPQCAMVVEECPETLPAY